MIEINDTEDFEKYTKLGVCSINESIKINIDVLPISYNFKLHVNGDIIAPDSVIDIHQVIATGLVQAYGIRAFNLVCHDLICKEAEICEATIFNIAEADRIVSEGTLRFNTSKAKKHTLNHIEHMPECMWDFELSINI